MKKYVLLMLFVASFGGNLIVKAQEPTTNAGIPIGAKWCTKHSVYDKCWQTAKTPKPRL